MKRFPFRGELLAYISPLFNSALFAVVVGIAESYDEPTLSANPKIVSLISSGTEILCALGLEKNLVGISHECDYPLSITSLPRLSLPKINITAPSGEIHKQVMDLVQQGLSIYHVDSALLEKLAPDLIVTQDQCEVCAVSLKDVENAVCGVTKKDTAVCSLKPYSLDEIVTDFRKVGRFTGKEKEAEDLATQFWIKLNAVNARAGTSGKTFPKVLCLEWLDPLIVGGGWMPEIVTLAGGENLLVHGTDHFKKITWEEAVASCPDYVVIMPCGYGMEKTLEELKSPEVARRLNSIPAVARGNCYVADGNRFFNRPGPRIAESCEIIAGIIHPHIFPDFVKTYLNDAYVQWKP